jgi:hypothetical protein
LKELKLKIPFLKINLISIGCFLFSFAYYFISKKLGNLPNPEEWFSVTNHGPWRWTFPGLFIIFPYQILIPITLFVGFKETVKHDSWRVLLSMFGTLFFQALFIMAQAKWLFWTID